MNHGNKNVNNAGFGNNQRNNGGNHWRPRSNRFNRFPPRSPGGQSMRPQYDAMRQEPPMEENHSTTLVNSIKQGVLAANNADRVSPVESPVNVQSCSPVHRPSNSVAAGVWQMDANWSPRQMDANWSPRQVDANWSPMQTLDTAPYPKCVPTLNGSPYSGGPISSPSPIGSSRGSPYSNSSPTQAISGSSSPMIANIFSNDLNGAHNYSAEEMLHRTCENLLDLGRASNSQSPEESNYNFNPMRRNVDSRLSDDASYSYYYRTSGRSSESRSSEDLSLDNIIEELRNYSPESGLSDLTINRNSNSSGSIKCNACTMERVCDNCAEIDQSSMLGYIGDRRGSPRENLIIEEITSNITGLDLVPFSRNQNMPMSNQLALVPANQMAISNYQLSIPNQMSLTIPYLLTLASTSGLIPRPPLSLSPLVFQNHRVMCERVNFYCSLHSITEHLYCQTCYRIFCNECGHQQHFGHVSVYLLEANDTAHHQAERVVKECRYGLHVIKEDIAAQSSLEQIFNDNASEASALVRSSTRKLVDKLQARERELLESIEASRKHKLTVLKIREEGLKFAHLYLKQTMIQLNRVIEASSLVHNPVDLIVAKDLASAQIFQVKHLRHNLPPLDTNGIRFQPNYVIKDHPVLSIGNIVAANGYIGDRRLLVRPIIRCLTPPTGWPTARAISGATFQVSIINNRSPRRGSPYFEISTPSLTIGNGLAAEDSLCRPWGVACDREGHIVIADRSNNRIQIFRINGRFVRRFGTHGAGPGQFDRPAGIAVDARRRIVVADKDNHRIQVLTMEGEFLLCFGEKGTTAGLFNYPWDVATNDACQIVVSDTRNHRIQLFSPEGMFLRKFGFETQPQLWKSFDSPRGVAFNNEGNVLVTDFNNHRIVVVDSDFIRARLLGYQSLSPHPMPQKALLRPQGIAVDDNGHIIVSDSRNHRVQILDANGICRWRFGSQSVGPEQMDRPAGVAVTPQGKIVVVDFGNNRVLVF